MDGAGNYYQNTGVILRIDQADEDVQQDYTFDTNDRQLGRAEGWYREVEPKPAAMVNQQIDTPADRSVDRHTPTDYLLKQLDPAMEFDGAGFDPRELPRLPAGLPAEAASTGGPPSSGSSEAARGDAEPSTP